MEDDPELGRWVDEHRPSATKATGQILMILFCLVIAIALSVVAAQQYESSEALKRVGMAELFYAGAGILIYAFILNQKTRVELHERGLRHTLGRKISTVRWSQLRSIEMLRINGRIRTLTLHRADGPRLVLNSSLERFDSLLEFFRARCLIKS